MRTRAHPQEERNRNYVETTHMGHEQSDGKAGDTYAPGFQGSSMVMAKQAHEAVAGGYSAAHDGWDTADHFREGMGVNLGDGLARLKSIFKR